MKLPIGSEACTAICQVKRPEKCARSRKNSMSEHENGDPGKTEGENKCEIQVVRNEAACTGGAR